MTLDEAIVLLKFNNKHIADLKNDDLQQIAEWLEELKSYKSDSVTRETFEKMKSKAYEKGYRQGYNKAIDDFMNIVEEKADGGYFDVGGYHDVTNDIVGILDQLAEQLKGGGADA